MRTLRILLALGSLLWATTAVAEVAPLCLDPGLKEEVRSLLFDGLKQAMRNRVSHLFDVRLADPKLGPQRAISGVQIAVRAYVNSRTEVAQWNPPPCEAR